LIVSNSINPADRVAPAGAGNDSALTRIIGGVIWRIAGRIGRWRDNARQRHDLQRLGPNLMKDIGISEADIWQEVTKPFWRD
jgi:uncharacterized protein YjiS (DUF1127 family)